jgi:hypothetical protein
MQQRALNDLCRIVELSAKLLTAQLEGPGLAEVQKLLAEKNVENERINRSCWLLRGLSQRGILTWALEVVHREADPLSKKSFSATSITKFVERSRPAYICRTP